MSADTGKGQGWDAKAIATIARERFGGFEATFVHHGWPERGPDMMRQVQRRVVETYGSVGDFVEANGENRSMMTPLEAIEADPPNVWLTSFDGFGPEEWGFVGFANKAHRDRFLRETEPGVLLLIWATIRAAPDERGKIVGILQCSHETGTAQDFSEPSVYTAKQANPKTRDKWDFAVRGVRAWRFEPNIREPIRSFAPKTFLTPSGTDRATFLGSQGDRLDSEEVQKLMSLTAVEVPVYRQPKIVPNNHGLLDVLLKSSRPGPVSQSGYWVEPAEGPKHLYLLKMRGKAATFLNDPSAFGKVIVKPGFSGDPRARCSGLNAAFPSQAQFRWEVYASTQWEGRQPFPTSDHAKVGEAAMQAAVLAAGGGSLGNEFFLVDPKMVDTILDRGIEAAKSFRP